MNLLPNLKKKKLGNKGEELASTFLQKKGYRIITRNFKARYGELDLIALHKGILVAVEVKTRIGSSFGKPEEAITPRKLHELVETFQYFVLRNSEFDHHPLRIDLVAIALDKEENLLYINHLENISGF